MYISASVCDRAALGGKGRTMGGIVRTVDAGEAKRGNAARNSLLVRNRCVRII